MPSIGSVLREEMARLSRREVRKLTTPSKRTTAQHRHHIAALNRRITALERQVAALSRQKRSGTAPKPVDAVPTTVRFVAKGLRSHRSLLGLSASDFGKLIGVSANSVYAWEQGTTPHVERR